MALLFDQNLPAKFTIELNDLFPGCRHVKGLRLNLADDATIWEFAGKNDFTIVSKDADFHQMSFLYGAPPKVIWLRCGNRTTKELEQVIRTNSEAINDCQ